MVMSSLPCKTRKLVFCYSLHELCWCVLIFVANKKGILHLFIAARNMLVGELASYLLIVVPLFMFRCGVFAYLFS